MDVIVKLFVKHTSPEQLQKYREQVHNTVSKSFNDHYQAGQSMLRDAGFDNLTLDVENMIVTGSSAEGASLARQFSSDPDTAAELELDLMLQLWTFSANCEKYICYIPENPAFLHFKIDESTLKQVRDVFSDSLDDALLSCTLIRHNDGKMYLNSIALKDMFQMASNAVQNENLLYSGCTTSDERGDEMSRQARAQAMLDLWRCNGINMTGSYEDRTEARPNASCASVPISSDDSPSKRKITEKSNHIFAETCLTIVQDVDRAATEMINILKICEDELITAYNPAHAASIEVQAQKASEYMNIAMKIFQKTYSLWEQLVPILFPESSVFPADVMTARWKCHSTLLSFSFQYFLGRLKTGTHAINLGTTSLTVTGSAVSTRETLDEIMNRFVSNGSLFLIIQHEFLKLIQFRDLFKSFEELEKETKSSKHWNKFHETLEKSSMDFVLCIRLDFWPSVADEWLKRVRQWPDAVTINLVAQKGVHVIGKQFCHADIDWRLSFSVAEIALAKLWTAEQHFVYFIFKSLFYRFIKPSNSQIKTTVYKRSHDSVKSISSYIVKTIMMHVSESFPQSWWSIENAVECLSVLLLATQSALECRRLQHYFISALNLLDGTDDRTVRRAIGVIENIRSNSGWAACELEPHFDAVKGFIEVADAQELYVGSCVNFVNTIPEIFMLPKEILS